MPRGAKAAAMGGGGIVGATAIAAGIIAAQIQHVKGVIGPRREVAPYHPDRFGPRTGTSIRIALIGDSVAAGLGAPSARSTIGGLTSEVITQATGKGVNLSICAVVGARSSDLDAQVSRALVNRPHVAIIVIGANDVTHFVSAKAAAQDLERAVLRLREAGTEVVVGTCPDLGTVRPVAPPLRWMARSASRKLAALQHDAVVRAGGRTVALGSLLGPEFQARPEILFAADQFHPSGEGYTRITEAVMPEVMAGLGLRPDDRLPMRTQDVGRSKEQEGL